MKTKMLCYFWFANSIYIIRGFGWYGTPALGRGVQRSGALHGIKKKLFVSKRILNHLTASELDLLY